MPSLHALVSRFGVALVVTQPDRPAGRGRRLAPTAVRTAAQELGLEVEIYEPARRRVVDARLSDLELDVLVVVAFGHILKPSTLATASRGAVNVHASLLPRWRGVAPIERALWAGESVTGVTLMAIDPGVDTGAMLAQRIVPIAAEDTRVTLARKLSDVGAELLAARLQSWVEGALPSVEQNDAEASYAPRLQKEEGQIDWGEDPLQIWRQVRALYGWPGAYTELDGERLKVHAVKPLDLLPSAAPGSVLYADARDGVRVACGGGTLALLEVQLPGRAATAATELVSGRKLRTGMRLGSRVKKASRMES
ncbi:MAG: methionyl-tRNA formyltransferase [Candidatus Latescibacterota bacterium]|nr:MAG: methionyl-tRNA formyltransferase [Candidatus Latescibacterota bacterium]